MQRLLGLDANARASSCTASRSGAPPRAAGIEAGDVIVALGEAHRRRHGRAAPHHDRRADRHDHGHRCCAATSSCASTSSPAEQAKRRSRSMSARVDRPRMLLQTTIPYSADDWHVGRFGMLRAELATGRGRRRARSRERLRRQRSGLSRFGRERLRSAVADRGRQRRRNHERPNAAAIARFRQRGGHMFVDAAITWIWARRSASSAASATAHYFHSNNPDPNHRESRQRQRGDADRLAELLQRRQRRRADDRDRRTGASGLPPLRREGDHHAAGAPARRRVGPPPDEPVRASSLRRHSRRSRTAVQHRGCLRGRRRQRPRLGRVDVPSLLPTTTGTCAPAVRRLSSEPPSDAIAQEPAADR